MEENDDSLKTRLNDGGSFKSNKVSEIDGPKKEEPERVQLFRFDNR
jgi:hypothetical protein